MAKSKDITAIKQNKFCFINFTKACIGFSRFIGFLSWRGAKGIAQKPPRDDIAYCEITRLQTAGQLRQAIQNNLAFAIRNNATGNPDVCVMICAVADKHFHAGRIQQHAIGIGIGRISVQP